MFKHRYRFNRQARYSLNTLIMGLALLSQICAIGCAVHVQLFQHSVGAGVAPAWSCCRCASARRAAPPVPGGPAATQFPRAFLDRRAHSLCGDIKKLRSVFHSSFVHIDRMFDTRFRLWNGTLLRRAMTGGSAR